MTLLEKKRLKNLRVVLFFEVIVKYVLTDLRYEHVIRKKRVNVTGTQITVTGGDL
ncbi:hypothetical protein COE42_11895 [Bacillus cereus]|nr:hypothetical protein COI82_04755 [Bacillus cereus]PFO55112.1 hypothetical protein COJ74_20975 [Bacillus cereus]PGO73563.1 hypothetical protein CN985_13035 [Bacillus cereus]PGQ65327.1 hypothetical protein COA21_22830 [Bacillus cereus]PGY75371.1 hypothetical protein COE42_11895 [Bacillus cereus]